MRALVFSTLVFLLIFNYYSVSVPLKKKKFQYNRVEPANELGIFSKVIAQVYRPAYEDYEEYTINQEYIKDEFHDAIIEHCNTPTYAQDPSFIYTKCSSDDEGLFYHWSRKDLPPAEPKNVTLTYMEMIFDPFSRFLANGTEEVCLLEENYWTKAYFLLRTSSEVSINNISPDDVPVFNQLDFILDKYFDVFFNDYVSFYGMYIFGRLAYENHPHHDCFLAMSTSESVPVIEKKCNFLCLLAKGNSTKDLERAYDGYVVSKLAEEKKSRNEL